MPDTLPAEYLDAIATRQEHRPRTWDDLIGNAPAKEILAEAVAAAKVSGRVVPHVILFGPSGMGKTSIAEILAREVGGGFVKTTASTLEAPVDVLRLIKDIWQAGNLENKPVVLFLDEIHMLGQSKGRQAIDVESIFPLIEDWVFYHNMQGKPFRYKNLEVTPKSGEYHVYPFTLVGATTDPGMLPTAMLRRFQLQIELAPYTDEEIARIIATSAARQGWAITEAAAIVLAAYARQSPGTAQNLLTQCHTRCLALGLPGIDEATVRFVIDRLRLHPLGLTENEVLVLEVLSRRPKGVGAAELSRAVGIAPTTFTSMQEPYLRRLGLIETLTRRVLTRAGFDYLNRIGRGLAA